MSTEALFPGLIDNPVTRDTARYAAILGLAPSKGARSPLLWNAAFAAAGVDARMVPMDVAVDRLAALVDALRADVRFLGGAVTMPHKQAIVPFLDRVEPEAAAIGAVNALYRDGAALVGANTDGAGALAQLDDLTGGRLAAKRVLVLGTGGAGRAVAAFLAGRVASLTLANRTQERAEALAAALGNGVRVVPWPVADAVLAGTDVLVNASAVGFAGGPAGSPLGSDALGSDVPSSDGGARLALLPADALVYDIVYQPAETALLASARARGLRIANGLGMNLDQAVIAFAKACPGVLDRGALRRVMAEAGR
ncbi:shikimate dehydrogenase family protein [Azospirillum sp. ST 5-10]|uniref:shikimate dehydrogenase family protein n=1 Tax=unclassified Azospirillum TaxID=2630922 RepID=UPI003F4A6E03